MKTAVDALGRGYVAAGHERLLIVPGPTDAVSSTEAGDVVQVRAPRVGGGYRVILEPWRVIESLEHFGPTSLEGSDKSTLVPVTRWARRSGVPSFLFSHERLDAMLALRTGWQVGVAAPVSVLNRGAGGQRLEDRPVVTADRGGARELVDRASGAWAAPYPEALADAVLRVAARPEEVRRAGARRRAEEFSWERTVAAMLDVHDRSVAQLEVADVTA